ncbi:MAG: ATP-binding protein, partial [Bdellovibrionaceae bacterium]|nr:ATP-binding protein [Pseudobdellovibrionaceae bacterium]
MKFFSFVKDGFFFIPVEIQVGLLPGLPEVKFTGLVDMAIKESATRLKSAFKKRGFSWPNKQQIIINLSPAYIKKNSPGMDLALASAILYKTGQIDLSHYQNSHLYFYGEVDLEGKVLTPQDWKFLPSQNKTLIIGSLEEENYKQTLYSANNLRELFAGKKYPAKNWEERLQAPKIPDISFSKSAGEILKICAVGEHSLLLCGAAGSGKSTLAEHVYYLLSKPSQKAFEQSEQILNLSQKWRAFINPHHTTSPLSMIGGGSPLFLGEISKAHGGMLLLDEYLEFHPKVQEALREPLEKGEIRLVRKGKCMVFPSQFLLVATSNLCPCGDYEPNKSFQCSYSLRRCQSHLDRLSGPMMDRFDLLFFSKDWK